MAPIDDAIREHAGKNDRATRKQAASDELRAAGERLSSEIDSTFVAFKRALLVERSVLGLTLFDSGLRVASYASAALVGLVVFIVAALLVVASARRGLALWTNGAWWSDLVLGVVLCALLAGIVYGVRRMVHRSMLAKTRRLLSQSEPAKPAPAPGNAA